MLTFLPLGVTVVASGVECTLVATLHYPMAPPYHLAMLTRWVGSVGESSPARDWLRVRNFALGQTELFAGPGWVPARYVRIESPGRVPLADDYPGFAGPIAERFSQVTMRVCNVSAFPIEIEPVLWGDCWEQGARQSPLFDLIEGRAVLQPPPRPALEADEEGEPKACYYCGVVGGHAPACVERGK